MKALIKSATLYSAALPPADLVLGHLKEKAFGQPTDLEASHVGFAPIPGTDEMLTEFTGGFAFALREDKKVIPPSALKEEHKRLIAQAEKHQGHKIGRKQRLELKEQALDTLLPRALFKSTWVTAFYHVEQQLLVVATSSNAMASTLVGKLIQAIGSVETNTLHVSEVKHGLTTRLKNWLGQADDDDAFGVFTPAEVVNLTRGLDGRKEKLAVSMTDLQAASIGLEEAIKAQFGVDAIRLDHGSTRFTLTSAFTLRSIDYEVPPDGEESGASAWQHEAAIELLQVAAIVKELVTLLSYKAPDAGAEAEAEFEDAE